MCRLVPGCFYLPLYAQSFAFSATYTLIGPLYTQLVKCEYGGSLLRIDSTAPHRPAPSARLASFYLPGIPCGAIPTPVKTALIAAYAAIRDMALLRATKHNSYVTPRGVRVTELARLRVGGT